MPAAMLCLSATIPFMYSSSLNTKTKVFNLLINRNSENEMIEIVTADLSKFGYRERQMAEQLLKAWREDGLPDGFYEEEVSINLNTNSGYVFLSNCKYQAAMMNGEKIEIFHYDFETGEEGFLEDLSEEVRGRISKCEYCTGG